MNGQNAFSGTDMRFGSPATSLKSTNSSANTFKPDYRWWVGEDGNIWANIEGTGVQNLGKYGQVNNTSWLKAINASLDDGKRIDNPNPSGQGNAGGGTDDDKTTTPYTPSTYDAETARLKAEQAKRKQQAEDIKSSMEGKRGQFADILKDILGNIDQTYSEEVTKLDESRDTDKADLIEALTKAIPEIGNSYAAIGAYDSSQRAGSNADTRKEEKRAEEDIDKEYNDNLANLGNKANEARTNANNAYSNFMIDFDTLRDTEASSDNLETIRQSQNSLLKGLSDFGYQKDVYKPGSTFANEISALNRYDGTKMKDAFDNYLATAGASGIKNNNGAGSAMAATKTNSSKKKDENEIEVNQKTGVK